MSLLTWTDQKNIYQEQTGLADSGTLSKGIRDMNTGATRLMAKFNREWNRHSRFTDLVASQQYYQMPEDAFMLKEVIVSTGAWFPPMEQIPDEFAWRMMNMLQITGLPTHYFIRGRNEIGLYPTPSKSVTSGIELVFAPRHTRMTQDDFTSGTVTVTNGSNVITHSAGGFTPNMAFLTEWFEVLDGSDDNSYQIASYQDASTLLLENNFQGPSNSGVSFRIGQVMDFPPEFLESPVDYALYRFYLKRGVIGNMQVQEYQQLWTSAIQEARDTYGQVSESQVISAEPRFRIYNPWRGDPPPSISA